MIYNSEALILSSTPYSNTSLICNLFTKEYGRLSIISKGARTLKNPNRAILQPLQFIDLHYYYKPKRNIQLLKEASVNKHFFNIKDNYTKMMYSYNILDITNQICKIENPNEIIFRLIKSVLLNIDTCEDTDIDLYYSFFQLQLLRYLGVQPLIDTCATCNNLLDNAIYNESIGQLVCKKCNYNDSDIKISNYELVILKYLSNTHINKLLDDLDIERISFQSIKKYLLYYTSYHIVNIKNIKSMKFIS